MTAVHFVPRRFRVALVAATALTVLVAGGCSTSPGDDAAGKKTAPAAQSVSVSTGPSEEQPSSAETPSGVTDPANPPPYIDRVEWVQRTSGRSLQVYPTTSGRHTIAEAARAHAWDEVRSLAPDADTPGMAAQFYCHWDYARLVDPDKPSWNLEPWRPVVDDQAMVAARCNPGGPEV